MKIHECHESPAEFTWTILTYTICTFLLINKKCTRTQNFNTTLITLLTISIVCAHYTTLTPHQTQTTTPHQNHINHKASITSICHNHQNTYNTPHNNPTHLPALIPPINTTTYIGNIRHTTHLHLKIPKYKNIQYYTWNNFAIIFWGGDIHTNLGPSPHILKNLPIEYTQRQKQYFIHNTLTLKYQYTHLEELFRHYLNHNTPHPHNPNLTHLRKHNSLLSKYPTNHQIYALIITYSPIPSVCNQHMTNNLDPRCLTILR